MNYFKTLKKNNNYLSAAPKKSDVLRNAAAAGSVEILPGSNNRAVIIRDGLKITLQSYDSIILTYDTGSNEITKYYFDNCSKTTLKHINTFLSLFTNRAAIDKKQWETL